MGVDRMEPSTTRYNGWNKKLFGSSEHDTVLDNRNGRVALSYPLIHRKARDGPLHAAGIFGPAACCHIRCSQADSTCPGARLAKSRGMRRTTQYAAVTRDERNAADGRFSTAWPNP